MFATIAYAVFAIGDSLPMFILGFTFLSLWGSFESGSDTALLYDSLKHHKGQKKFADKYGNMRMFRMIPLAIVSIVGVELAKVYSMETLLFTGSTIFAIGGLIGLTLKEPPVNKKITAGLFTNIKEVKKFVWKNKSIREIIIFLALFGGISSTVWIIMQPHFSAISNPSTTLGVAMSFYFIFSAVGYAVIGKFKKEIMIPSCISVGVLFLLLYNAAIPLAILLVSIVGFIQSIVYIRAEEYVQHKAHSSHRATVASVMNMSESIVAAIVGPLLGLSVDVFSTEATFLLIGISLLVIGVYYKLINHTFTKE